MKSCKKGYYYCNTDKKCKPIPEGSVLRDDGFLMKETLDKKDKPFIKHLVKKLKSGSKTHAKQADDLEKAMNEDKHGDHEPEMIRNQLKTAGRASKRIAKHSRKKDNFKAWVQSKITKASDYLDTAADYLDSKEVNEEGLRAWFGKSSGTTKSGRKVKGWVQVGGKYDGKPCARQPGQKTTPKCTSSSKRRSMSDKERDSAARRKRAADPNQPQKSGAAAPTMVSTDPKRKMKEEFTTLPLRLEIPKSALDFKQGLMFRESLDTDSGMLFVFDNIAQQSFHMTETRIPLDIAFIREDGVIESIKQLEPNNPIPVYSEGDIELAIEVNRGWFAENNVEVGDQLDVEYIIPNQREKYRSETGTIHDIINEVKDKKGKGSGTKDACYHKVKSRYSVWPSAYASGALVKCRKVGAANWGNKSEAYEVTNADKKGNTPAYQGLKAGKKNKLTGKPLYKAADHMKENSVIESELLVQDWKKDDIKFTEVEAVDIIKPEPLNPSDWRTDLGEMKRDEYGDPIGGPKISKKQKAKNLASNTPDEQHTTATSEGMAYGISKGSGKPSGQMAAFGKQEKKPNPYGKRAKLKMIIKSIAEKERSKAGVTSEEVVDEAKVDKVKSPIYSTPRTLARNERKFGKKGSLEPQGYFGQKPSQAAELSKKRTDEHKAKRGVKTKGMSEAMNPAQQAAIAISKKQRLMDLMVAKKKKKSMKEENLDEKCWKGYEKKGMKTMFGKRYPNCVKKKVGESMVNWRDEIGYEGKDEVKKLSEDDMKGMSVSSGHKRPTKSGAGMTQKGVEAYRRKNPGSKLKTAVTTEPSKLKKGSKASNRRKSYCARSAGQMKKFPKAAKDPNSRLRQARRRWNC